MLVRKRLSAKEWESLSFSDKEVLETLNLTNMIKPKKKAEAPQAEPRVLPKPYILLRISACRLCKTVAENYFRMLPAKENRYLLEGKRITPENVLPSDTIVKKEVSYATCNYCYKILEKETKFELIRRIILLENKRR